MATEAVEKNKTKGIESVRWHFPFGQPKGQTASNASGRMKTQRGSIERTQQSGPNLHEWDIVNNAK